MLAAGDGTVGDVAPVGREDGFDREDARFVDDDLGLAALEGDGADLGDVLGDAGGVVGDRLVVRRPAADEGAGAAGRGRPLRLAFHDRADLSSLCGRDSDRGAVGEGDPLSVAGEARGLCAEAVARQLAEIGAVAVHHEHLCVAVAAGDEGNAAAVVRDVGVEVLGGVVGEIAFLAVGGSLMNISWWISRNATKARSPSGSPSQSPGVGAAAAGAEAVAVVGVLEASVVVLLTVRVVIAAAC